MKLSAKAQVAIIGQLQVVIEEIKQNLKTIKLEGVNAEAWQLTDTHYHKSPVLTFEAPYHADWRHDEDTEYDDGYGDWSILSDADGKALRDLTVNINKKHPTISTVFRETDKNYVYFAVELNNQPHKAKP